MNKKFVYTLVVIFSFIVIGIIFFGKSSDFDKRRICHQDASGNEFVFYSTTFDSCVEYFCYHEKMDPDTWADPLEISPGCEVADFYTGKTYKAFGCSNELECKNKLEAYK